MEIITLSDAKSKNLTHYFTSKPCKYGHVSERRTKGNVCLDCAKYRQQKLRDVGLAPVSKDPNKYYRENKEKCNIASAKWKKNNPDKVRTMAGLPEPTRPYPEDGRCEICSKQEHRKHQSGTVCKLSLDHDHITGEFRGWLCGSCNLTEGKMDSSCHNIMKLHDYLMKFKSEQLLKSQIDRMVF